MRRGRLLLTVEPDPDEDGETAAAEEGLLDVGAARGEELWRQRAPALSDGVEQLARDNLCIVVRGTARLDITGKRAGAGGKHRTWWGAGGARRGIYLTSWWAYEGPEKQLVRPVRREWKGTEFPGNDWGITSPNTSPAITNFTTRKADVIHCV